MGTNKKIPIRVHWCYSWPILFRAFINPPLRNRSAAGGANHFPRALRVFVFNPNSSAMLAKTPRMPRREINFVFLPWRSWRLGALFAGRLPD
jgi:hypothetical protein